MLQGQIPKIPRQSLIYLVLCVLGAVAFLVVGVVPARKVLTDLDNDIGKLKLHVEQQKILYPLYQALETKARAAGQAVETSPEKKGVPRDRIDKVPVILGDIATHCGLEVLVATPDARSISADPNLLLVHATVKGKLPDLRRFLIELATLPYMEHLEQLRVYEAKNGKEYSLRMWLRVSGQG
jgi:hypothetical protein